MMRLALVAALALSLCGCRTIVITEIGEYDEDGFAGLRNTVNTSLADVRRSDSTITIDDKGEDQGVQVVLDKFEASEQFMGMVEEVAPEIAAAIVKALLAQGAISAVGGLPSLLEGTDGAAEVPEVPEAVE